ncbi:MAG: hypothetical protein J6Y02_19520 [Pseudobutyrivibrio sp.]|nr:hypothetical protein [Pseudobutyrivibrio sp.]
MKKIKLVNDKANTSNDYRRFVAKNVKLTPYDKALLQYINTTIRGHNV